MSRFNLKKALGKELQALIPEYIWLRKEIDRVQLEAEYRRKRVELAKQSLELEQIEEEKKR